MGSCYTPWLLNKVVLMLVIPDFARPVLSSFAPVFYHPTYQRFLVLLVAAVLTTGRRTVSNLLRTAADLAHGRRLQLSPRPLQATLVHPRHWRGILARFILDHWVPDGPVCLAGDDTVDEHRGAKVYGKGCHRDPVRSTHSYTAYRWGHKWVVLAILVKFPFATRPWALPVLAALYRNPEKAPKAKAPAAKARRQQGQGPDQGPGQGAGPPPGRGPSQGRGQEGPKAKARSRRRHKTPSELMRQLLAVLIHWFPDRQFVFAGDGGYGTHALARFAAAASPAPDAGEPVLRQRGAARPAAGGRGQEERPPPQEGGRSGPPPRRWWPRPSDGNALEVSWYGGGRRDGRGGQRDGPLAQVGGGAGRGVVGVRARPDRDPPRLVPLQHRPDDGGGAGDRDLHRSLEYRDDLPGDAGVPRVGDDAGPDQERRCCGRRRACSGLYSVVALLYAELPAETTAEGTVSYRGKAEVTFSDAISVVRRQLWLEGVFESHGQTEVFRNLPRALQAVILAALAPAA